MPRPRDWEKEDRLAAFVIAMWRRVDEHVFAILRLTAEPRPLPESIGILARVLWEARVKMKYLRKHRAVAYRQLTRDGLIELRKLRDHARAKTKQTVRARRWMDAIIAAAEEEARVAKLAARAGGRGMLDPARHPGLPKLDELASLLKIKWEYTAFIWESAGTHASFAAASNLIEMTKESKVRQKETHPDRLLQVLSLAAAAYHHFLIDTQFVLGLPRLTKRLVGARNPPSRQ